MSYEIIYHELVAEDLKGMPKETVLRVMRDINRKLSVSPETFGKRLRGELKGYLRIRVGEYRIVYRFSETDRKVRILKIGQRKDAIVYIDSAKRV